MTKIPSNHTEQEVLDIIDNVVNRLAQKFKFGYHSLDDIKQDGRLEAWKALAKYDESRPLENFLYIAVHHRLFNNKRDNFERPDKPCYKCPFDAYIKDRGECSKFNNMLDCELFNSWHTRNSAKRNLMNTLEIYNVRDEKEKNMRSGENPVDTVANREIIDIIEANIPMNLRSDYFRLKSGLKLNKPRREKVREAIDEILKEYNIDY